MYSIIKLNIKDNVGIAPMDIPKNIQLEDNITSQNEIPYGHKISLKKIEKEEFVYRYGQIIGLATKPINPGEHVHSHNLGYIEEYNRKVKSQLQKNFNVLDTDKFFFQGYKRPNGKTGTRNYIGIISTVNCSATVVKAIADRLNKSEEIKQNINIDGIVSIKHSSGCGMNSEGYGMKVFNNTIEGFKNHPNFAKVFVIGLGCECAQISIYEEKDIEKSVVYMNIQDEGGTKKIIEKTSSAIFEQLSEINKISRTKIPISELIVALQCGGSDSYAGVTANPALGFASDTIVQNGGSTILAETPEIYGAEHLLIERAVNKKIIEKLNKQIAWWKNYTSINNGSLDNNPTPGNKRGGLTTILEKSLGAVAKGGTANLHDVLDYAEPLKNKGFNFMDSPGFDPCSVTGQVASGSNIICFTTGRGSCFGFKLTPSIKLATNTNMYNKMSDDMDINCGTIMDGIETIEESGNKIFNLIIETASGRKTKSEINGYGDEEFNPWIIGATM